MVTISRVCAKCLDVITIDKSEAHTIKGELCAKCFEDWSVFFKKNYTKLEKQYPNYAKKANDSHVTWDAFIGKLKIKKETFVFR